MEIREQGFVINSEEMAGNRRSHMFTSLHRLASGRILISFRRGTTKSNRNGNCVVYESDDEGRHWTCVCDEFPNSFSGKTGEIRAAELLEPEDGSLHAFLTWIDHSERKNLPKSEADTLSPTKLLHTLSRDDGESWSSESTALDTGSANHPVLSGPTLKIPGKGYVLTYEKQEPRYEGGPSIHSGHALFSETGESFDSMHQVVRDPRDRLFYYDQRQCVSPDGRRFFGAFWTYDREAEKDANIHTAWGDTGSLTWEKPVDTGLQGQIAAPLIHPDGRIFLFYVHRTTPGSMRLVVSEDNGRSWNREKERVIYSKEGEREPGVEGEVNYEIFWESMDLWTFGHPTSILLDDGTLLLAYYAGPDEKTLSVRWAVVRI